MTNRIGNLRQSLAIRRREVLQLGGFVGLSAIGLAACDALSTDPDTNESGLDGERSSANLRESPMLTKRVDAGDLPKLEDRLPRNPAVVLPFAGQGSAKAGLYGGTLRMQISGIINAHHIRVTTAMDRLVRWNTEEAALTFGIGDLVESLAETFEANAEGTEFVFGIREGTKWSDGMPFTADDLVFAQQVLSDLALYPSPDPRITPTSADKIDELTVRFSFEEPYSLFASHVATAHAWHLIRLPFHYLKEYHRDHNPNIDELVEAEGASDWADLFERKTGIVDPTVYWQNPDLPTLWPWMVVQPLGEGARTVLQRNPYYWKVDANGSQLPYIDEAVFDLVDDPETMLLKTTNGEIDLNWEHQNTLPNKPVLASSRETGNYHFIDLHHLSTARSGVALNLAHSDPVKREIFNNLDFRIGLSHAINRQEIIDAVYQGIGEVAQVAPLEGSPFYDEEYAKQYTEYDVELANSHLDKAGYSEQDGDGFRLGPDGKRISFQVDTFSDPPDDIVMVADYWKEVGIDMTPRIMDRSLYYSRKEGNEHDANTMGGADSELLDPRAYFPFSLESNFAIPWARWFTTNGEAGEEPPAPAREQMELYKRILTTTDPDEQQELMKQVLQIAKEQFWTMSISGRHSGNYAVVHNRVHNVPEQLQFAWQSGWVGHAQPERFYIDENASSASQ